MSMSKLLLFHCLISNATIFNFSHLAGKHNGTNMTATYYSHLLLSVLCFTIGWHQSSPQFRVDSQSIMWVCSQYLVICVSLCIKSIPIYPYSIPNDTFVFHRTKWNELFAGCTHLTQTTEAVGQMSGLCIIKTIFFIIYFTFIHIYST